ncbi:acyltransferase family protein [Burkholderia pyrrocinia]|uniref:acyltransferase family protein n=1 Tax=Burkholderia pyrrocinia TaxID=60550 RepID=UPI00158CDC38|nr:acyltransferase [Burkholderia pyrrocinia]
MGTQTTIKHIKALDGLRGFAALAVTMFHGILHFDTDLINRVLHQPAFGIHGTADWIAKIALTVFNGESAVILFFVLSGYVLGSSIDRSLDHGYSPTATSIEFLIKRVARIYPAMIVCMLVYWGLSKLLVGHIYYAVIDAGIAWHSSLLYEVSVHGPSWSLQVEMFAAPFVLAMVLFRRRFGMFALILIGCYAMFAIEYPVLVGGLNNLWPYLISFCIGVALSSPQFEAIQFEAKPAHLTIALLVFVFARAVVPRAAISGLIAQSILAGLVVFTAARSHEGRCHEFLTNRLALFLGRISYSFYLLNVPFLYLVWGVIAAIVPDPKSHYMLLGLLSGALATLITIPFATVSARYVEQPTIAIVSRWLKQI